ncbi:MAG: 4-hydroxythreonine-4-phosphate dehydrogenase PdxA [Tannerellaceae bacterium]|nr:4-hydroxythreonine-4-phosphate dehydrogenase PdxA [Tannerellaceae bacterium]
MEGNTIRIGITQGDSNGVGYEVILKTLSDERITELCTPVIYGSLKSLHDHRQRIPGLSSFPFKEIRKAEAIETGVINFIPCSGGEVAFTPGQGSEESGLAAYHALEAVVRDLKGGHLHALLTAPIDKDSIQNEDFHFPGHTEYLEHHFGVPGQHALMILMNDQLRVALVTGHVALSEVPGLLSKESIVTRLVDFDRSLRQDFCVIRPRIAVLALNPHGGDGGLIGTEEKRILRPAIEKATQEGLLAFGPYPADGFFGSRGFTRFDGVLAMYHDQGLIPFKSLVMKNGVNYTGGLSIIRTSPAHGTAYDIAGQGIASPDSFRQALFTAIDACRQRAAFQEASSNPLVKPAGPRFERSNKGRSKTIKLKNSDPDIESDSELSGESFGESDTSELS